jgi:hypothetical protein
MKKKKQKTNTEIIGELERLKDSIYVFVEDENGNIVKDGNDRPVFRYSVMKDPFIMVLSKLDFFEVYDLFKIDKLMYFFFLQFDVWRSLWIIWNPDTHEIMTNEILKVVPEYETLENRVLVTKKKKINFLWVHLAHIYASRKAATQRFRIDTHQNLAQFTLQIYAKHWESSDKNISIESVSSGAIGGNQARIFTYLIIKNFGIKNLQDEFAQFVVKFNHVSLMKTIYETMATFKGAKIDGLSKNDEYYHSHRNIRSEIIPN